MLWALEKKSCVFYLCVWTLSNLVKCSDFSLCACIFFYCLFSWVCNVLEYFKIIELSYLEILCSNSEHKCNKNPRASLLSRTSNIGWPTAWLLTKLLLHCFLPIDMGWLTSSNLKEVSYNIHKIPTQLYYFLEIFVKVHSSISSHPISYCLFQSFLDSSRLQQMLSLFWFIWMNLLHSECIHNHQCFFLIREAASPSPSYWFYNPSTFSLYQPITRIWHV